MTTRAEAHWNGYQSPGFFDEMLVGGGARTACEGVIRYLAGLGDDLLERPNWRSRPWASPSRCIPTPTTPTGPGRST
jgi:hypothetical protein